MVGLTLLAVTAFYAVVRIISIFLMFLGYDLMTADGKEFIIGTSCLISYFWASYSLVLFCMGGTKRTSMGYAGAFLSC
ncbi:hypothetical protein RKD55_000857 [Rossellomorea marisflavi]